MRDLLPSLLGGFAEWLTNAVLRMARWLSAHRVKAALLVLALACSLVGAQSGDTAASGTPQVQTQTLNKYDFTPESTISLISSTVSSSLQSLSNNSSLRNYGNLLTGLFLIAMMTWAAVKTLAASKGIGELLGEWIPILVGFGVVYLFLDRSVGSQIVSMMDGIAAAIGGSSMSTLDGAIKAGALPIFKGISSVLKQPSVTDGALPTGLGALGFLATLGASAVSIIMGAIAKVITCFVLVMVGVVMVAHIVMGFLSVQLVLALAPVMVPFLLFPPASWIFDGWLKFLLGACMLKVVVAFLLVMVGGLLSGMSGLAKQIYDEAYRVQAVEAMYVDILLYGLMMVFALLAAMLMHQAPSIATGLLSGNAGGAGFKGIASMTQSPAGRVASNASSAATQAAGRATAGALGRAGAWVKGRADGNRSGAEKDLRHRSPQAQAAYSRGYRSGQKKYAANNPAPESRTSYRD